MARWLALVGVGVVALAIVGWLRIGWIAAVVALVAAAVLFVVASRLRRVELVLRTSGIEVVDVTGRRRQAWVGTKRLTIDFSAPRPVLEIDAPGPGEPYRSTLVLAGLETDEHRETRARLVDVARRYSGPTVTVEFREPGGRSGA